MKHFLIRAITRETFPVKFLMVLETDTKINAIRTLKRLISAVRILEIKEVNPDVPINAKLS